MESARTQEMEAQARRWMVEAQATTMGLTKAANVRMFRIVISSEAAAQQAEMFGDGGQSPPIVGPLPEAGGDVNSPAQASTCCSTPCPWRPSKVRKAPRCL